MPLWGIARAARACPSGVKRRHPPVRRIDNERRAPRRNDPCAAVVPGFVVGAGHVAVLARPSLKIDVACIGDPFGVGRHLFFGDELLVGQFPRPL